MNKELAEEDYSTDVSEPSYSNRGHTLEVIYTSNMTLEILEDGSYGRKSKFIFNVNYFCILLLMKFS